MVKRAKENLGNDQGKERMNVLADKGYHSGRELKGYEIMGVKTFISPKESSSSKTNPAFAMKSFQYNEKEYTYTCPAREKLLTNGKWYNKKLNNGRQSYLVKHYKTKSCENCNLGEQCTSNKRGRFIEKTEYQEYTDINNDRVNIEPDYYRQRQQIIEHQFGTIKRQWHFDYTLTKGKEKVMGEVYLIFTCYNLKRVLSIFGFEALMSKIKALIILFLGSFRHLLFRINAFTTISPPYYIKEHSFFKYFANIKCGLLHRLTLATIKKSS